MVQSWEWGSSEQRGQWGEEGKGEGRGERRGEEGDVKWDGKKYTDQERWHAFKLLVNSLLLMKNVKLATK